MNSRMQKKVPGKKGFRKKKGFGTLEIVIIIAVIITVALIFRENLIQYANNLFDVVFDQSVISDLESDRSN